MNAITELIHYAIRRDLISDLDYDYAFNRLNAMFDEDYDYEPYDASFATSKSIDTLLKPLLDQGASENRIHPDTTQMRDLFESRIMDVFTPHPGDLQKRFDELFALSPKRATDDFYARSKASNYIKMARIEKNIAYQVDYKYGTFDITINLSKPEKDPKDIKAAKSSAKNGYPPCLLCKENVGFFGHATHPGRTNHRIIKTPINDEPFYFQFSPYVYYNEHAIVLHEDHIPMDVGRHTFSRLFDFVDKFPHYFLGSNAGLPIVGGSILAHEHYQGGNATFPIDKAAPFFDVTEAGVRFELLYWPLSVIRLRSDNRKRLIDTADALRRFYAGYSDEDVGLYAKTDEPHNAITPILRKVESTYILDIALRNNRTDDQHPEGIFHPHREHHHIKKENIGLIEVMGLAILPGRLADDLDKVAQVLSGASETFENIDTYFDWIMTLKETYAGENPHNFVRNAAGVEFVKGLEDCGIFKQTDEGRERFKTFLKGFLQWHSK